MKNTLRFALVALTTTAFSFASAPPALAAESNVHSLRGADIQVTDQAPEEKLQVGKRPGRQKIIPRTFDKQPPIIPHATENYDEITLVDNQCLSCHGPENFKAKNAPAPLESHFRNQQTGEIMKQVSSARYNCVLCHVPQFDAPPLVENTFQTVPQVQLKKKR